MPKMVTIGWLGAAPHIGEIYREPYIQGYIPYLTFFFVTNPTDQTTEPICTHNISNDADCSKEVPFGGLINEKFFHGGISLPQNFQRAFDMQIEKVE
jgi:hypothetical protein